MREKSKTKRKLMHKLMGGREVRRPASFMLRYGVGKSMSKFGTSFAVRAGASAVFGAAEAALVLMIGYDIGEMIYQGMAAYEFSDPFQKNSFSENAMDVFSTPDTQRQAALAQLHNSQLTVRAVLGNEAGIIHG